MARRARSSATGFLRDFQEFISRGNVIDLAVAVIIGAAFTKIVEAFVNWITSILLNPVLQRAGVDQLRNLPLGVGELVIAVINFLLVALVIFLVVQAVERFMRKQEVDAPPDPVLESQERLTAAIDRLTETMTRR